MELTLDLQRFALNTQVTTDTDLSPEMKTFYKTALLKNAQPKLVHDQFADKYNIPSNNGKTVEMRRFNQLGKATTALEEGITPTGENLKVEAITATVSQYGSYVAYSDMIKLSTVDNTVAAATELLGSQAGRTLDTITREVIAAGTQVIFAPKIVSGAETAVTQRSGLDATAKLTPDLFFKAAAQLEAANASTIDGSYVAIIHPYAAYDLMRSDEWIDVHKYDASDNIFNGEIGKIGNVRFVKSTEAKIWKDSTCPSELAVFGTIVVGAHAYATTEIEGGGLEHIVKPLGFADPLNQVGTIGWKATKTAKILSNEYMVRIESCSAYSGTATAN